MKGPHYCADEEKLIGKKAWHFWMISFFNSHHEMPRYSIISWRTTSPFGSFILLELEDPNWSIQAHLDRSINRSIFPRAPLPFFSLISSLSALIFNSIFSFSFLWPGDQHLLSNLIISAAFQICKNYVTTFMRTSGSPGFCWPCVRRADDELSRFMCAI